MAALPEPNLWALDVDESVGGTGQPWQAHLIVQIDGAGTAQETRLTACGERCTRTSHPRGWWTTKAGSLPLQNHAVHCGMNEIT